jgi:hypothetical protein
MNCHQSDDDSRFSSGGFVQFVSKIDWNGNAYCARENLANKLPDLHA